MRYDENKNPFEENRMFIIIRNLFPLNHWMILWISPLIDEVRPFPGGDFQDIFTFSSYYRRYFLYLISYRILPYKSNGGTISKTWGRKSNSLDKL
jgi:hypothetical protein